MHWTEVLIIAFGLGVFGAEYTLLRWNGRKVDGQQVALNLSLGMIERLFALLSFSFGVWLFAEVVELRVVPSIRPNWLNFALAFVLVDFFWYAYHRASHRISLIWVAHLIHHQPTEYNFSVNFANSPLGQLVRVVVYSPMMLFGLDPEYVILANVINAFYQALLHSELWPAWVGLERFIVTPRFHQIHHSSAHVHLDRNYGGIFTVWDRIFGSYYDGREPVIYGLTKPLAQRDPFHVSAFYAARLIQNFRELPVRRAVWLLFAGPEHQPAEMPRLYRVPVAHHPMVFVLGFVLFFTGFVLTGSGLVPFWLAFALAFVGIFVASGIVPLPTRAKAHRAEL